MVWIAVGALLAIGFAWMFNRLVRLRQRARNAWSDIDVQLKRRWDLVPALVATVQGYAAHERTVLEQVTAARAGFVPSSGPTADRADREAQLARSIRSLFALAEAYPQLKADQSFLSLHASLVQIEDALQSARRYYNAVVRDYNTLVHSVPTNAVAAICGFRDLLFFQLDEAERAVPEVRFPAQPGPGA